MNKITEEEKAQQIGQFFVDYFSLPTMEFYRKYPEYAIHAHVYTRTDTPNKSQGDMVYTYIADKWGN